MHDLISHESAQFQHTFCSHIGADGSQEMNNKYGPTHADLKFRLIFSIFGFGLLVFAIAYRGWPQGPGGWEAIGIGAIFFGGTFLWTLRKMIKGDYPDGL